MDQPTIEQLDVDGAIRDGADAVARDPRARFLRAGVVGAAGLVGGGAVLAMLSGAARAATPGDIAILNFALTLEYLERDFYAQSLAQGGAGSGRQKAFATTAHDHESAHVAALVQALGSSATPEPTFDFGAIPSDPAKFRATAIVLEDTGVRAYKGQAPNIQEPTVLAAALAIHSVEANHAAWIRYIAGADPTYTGAFELPLTMAETLAAVDKTGFIVT